MTFILEIYDMTIVEFKDTVQLRKISGIKILLYVNRVVYFNIRNIFTHIRYY